MISDGNVKSNELDIKFNMVVLYKDDDINFEVSNLNENNINMNFEYKINLESTIESEDISYNIITKKCENNDIEIKNAISDETGLNLLIEAKNSDITVNVKNFIGKEKENFYFIKLLDNFKKRFMVNLSNIENKDKIKLELKSEGKINEYELIRK